MARTAIHSDDIPIEQRPNINIDDQLENGREAQVIPAGEQVLKDTGWLDNMKFNEEWVTIRLEPSTERNPAQHMYVAVNGIGCECLLDNGRVVQMPYLPVGETWTVRRKYLAVIVTAKIDTILTDVGSPMDGAEYVRNAEKRRTSAVHSFSVLEDKNPHGAAWLAALRRKNM